MHTLKHNLLSCSSAMFAILLEGVIVSAVSLVFWKFLQRFVFKSPLDNIPGPPSQSFLFGVYPQVFNIKAWDFHKDIILKYGGVAKIKAFLGETQLYIFDPKALYHIVIKDQHIYEEPSGFTVGNRLAFGPGLLGITGDQHRKQRKMLNPVFSSAHLRKMVPIFFDVTNKLHTSFVDLVKDGPQEVEMLAWMTRLALELIGQSGLGYSFDPLTEDGDTHPYATSAKQLAPTLFKFAFYRTYIVTTLEKIGTPAFRRFVLNLLPWKTLHELRDIVDVLHNTSIEIFEEKKKALETGDKAVIHQIDEGNDIMSILMKANMTASKEDRLSRDELLGQMTTLIFAAMDTTSNALSRIIHLLSIHPDVQNKLRQEFVEAWSRHGTLGFDELLALPYLDAICRETLRLYAPIPLVQRTTTQDVVLPLSNPIKGLDGREISEIPLPANSTVILGLLASNRNPEIWGPDSFEWKPERWMAPLPESVSEAHLPGVYSNLMTFNGGGRACIGFKFSQLEIKVVLSLLLPTFEFTPAEKEIAWQMAIIVSPIVPGGDNRPQLPVVMKLIKPVVKT